MKDDSVIDDYNIKNNDFIEVFYKIKGGSGNNEQNTKMVLCNMYDITITNKTMDILHDEKGWLDSDLVMLGIELLCNETYFQI